MPVDATEISKMPMPGGNVNAPASGTYGEGAALEALKKQLPSTPAAGPSTQNPVAPMPTPPAGAGVSNTPAPGLPSALLAPTQRPDVPVSTPLAGSGPAPMPMSAQQQRLHALDVLANDPNVSPETREWAQALVARLAGRSQ